MDKCAAAVALEESRLFEGIGSEDIVELMRCSGSTMKKFRTGETVCVFEGTAQKVGVIVEGEAELERVDYAGNRTVLEILSAGDVFGQTLAFGNLTGDMLDVVAKSCCAVVFIPADFASSRCANACLRHTQFVRNMLGIISSKAQSLSERIEVLSNRSIRDKLMCYFTINCAKARSDRFEMPFSLTTLADYICCDRSAMMRELGQMKEEGMIEVEKRLVIMR